MNVQPLFIRLYRLAVIILIALCFVVFNPDNGNPIVTGVVATNLQQILVLLGLGGLPGVLVWSSREVKKLKTATYTGDKLARYRKVVYVRLAVFFAVGLYALLVQYLTAMKGGLMFMMVVFVLFVFVWPSKARFEAEMGDETETGATAEPTETFEHAEEAFEDVEDTNAVGEEELKEE